MARRKNELNEEFKRLLPHLPERSLVELIRAQSDWERALQDLTGNSNDIYPTDIHQFIHEILGYTLWSKQTEIVNSVINNPFTVVGSAHSVGKSLLSSALAVAWYTIFPDSKVITVAPNYKQVNNILWSYMRSMVRQNNILSSSTEILDTPRWRDHENAEHFALGVSPKRSTEEDIAGFQGWHAPKLIVIMDEAAGLPAVMWQAVRNLTTGRENRVLAIGNPIQQSGPFWEACNSQTWSYIHISGLEHPNVITGDEIIPGAISREWVIGMTIDHCTVADEMTPNAFFIPWWNKGEGQWFVPDSVYLSRVLGIAPGINERQLIPLEWIRIAQGTTIRPLGEKIIGLDPSRGGDMAAMVGRQGGKVAWIKRRKLTSKNKGVEIAEWLKEEMILLGATKAYIEDVGIGAAAVDIGRQMGLPIISVYPSGKATQSKKFHNKRAEMWWQVRYRLQKELLELPDDDMLEADLCAPEYEFDLNGRIQIEKKENIRKRIGRSPDSGDALAISFSHDTLLDDEYYRDGMASNIIDAGPTQTSAWSIPQTRQHRSGRWSVGGRSRFNR